jgi:putative tryptophan/tyrosine transport system substrate-binding protein
MAHNLRNLGRRPELRLVRRACSRLHLDQIRPHSLVNSLARPNGNTTGVSILATELNGKRQEILMEVLPGVRRMAALDDVRTHSPQRFQILQNVARARGVELSVYLVAKPKEIAGAIEAANNAGAAALNVLGSLLLYSNRKIIFKSVATLSLPAIYQSPEMAEEDGFIAYGPSLMKIYRDMPPLQLAALLRGAKVSDVPVEQPTEFELAINLRTAKALGLSIPEAFLLRADKVIE